MRACRRFLLLAALAAAILPGPARLAVAQSADKASPGSTGPVSDGAVRIGLILDMSGPYSGLTGVGSATAARMAVEDFGGRVLGAPIEVLVADHQNSTNRAGAIAREWFVTDRVDAIMDVSGSSEALIVQAIAGSRNKVVSLSAPGAVRLSNEACTPTSVHYVSNTRAVAQTLGTALVARGADSWFFITVDYSFGYDLERDTTDVIEAQGGKVLGTARHPLATRDFASYLAQAQESRAKIVGLANAGADMTATIAQAAKLGMIGKQTFAGLAMRVNHVDLLGLPMTQGMMLTEPFYWDLNEATRAWSARFFEQIKKMPNSLQAGVYSSTKHYLQAITKAGTDATEPVISAMRSAPINDFFAQEGQIRADGVMVHDMHLFQVKTPAQSRGPWDFLRLVATMPGGQAFGSLSQSKCPLLTR
jgi:branched-chain amino acid transport system substrate-binding protein